MKTIKRIMLMLVIVTAGMLGGALAARAQGAEVSLQVFYDQLSPYGRWIDYPSYGYVWVPAVTAGFRPYYTSGHWSYSDDGWMWVSDYPWGWAPFHYGRWFYDEPYGWMWVPGTEWGPSWVVWRHAAGCYGWAPIAPGISLTIALGPTYVVPENRWIFINDRHIMSRHLNKYYIAERGYAPLIRGSVIITGTRIDPRSHVTHVFGPPVGDVERITSRRIRPVVIHDNPQPGHRLSKGNVWIYRPEVAQHVTGRAAPAPVKVIKYDEFKSSHNQPVRSFGSSRGATTTKRVATPARTVPQRSAVPQNRAVPQRSAPPQRVAPQEKHFNAPQRGGGEVKHQDNRAERRKK